MNQGAVQTMLQHFQHDGFVQTLAYLIDLPLLWLLVALEHGIYGSRQVRPQASGCAVFRISQSFCLRCCARLRPVSITKAPRLHFFQQHGYCQDSVNFLPIDCHCFWVLEHQHLHVSLTWKSFFKVKSQLQPVRLAARRGCQLTCSLDVQLHNPAQAFCSTSVPLLHILRQQLLTWMLQLFTEPGNADSLKKTVLIRRTPSLLRLVSASGTIKLASSAEGCSPRPTL